MNPIIGLQKIKKYISTIERTRKLFGEHKLILSVDRLDYSKGILHRLRGFATFLEHHAEYHGKVTLAMVIVPSRDHVGSYAELKQKLTKKSALSTDVTPQ